MAGGSHANASTSQLKADKADKADQPAPFAALKVIAQFEPCCFGRAMLKMRHGHAVGRDIGGTQALVTDPWRDLDVRVLVAHAHGVAGASITWAQWR